MDTASPRPALLELPTELLHNIFTRLIPINQTFSITENPRSTNHLRSLTRNRIFTIDSPITPLLLINRASSAVFLDILYGWNTFLFEEPWLIDIYVLHVGLGNVERIRHLSVEARWSSRDRDTGEMTTYWSIISRKFTNLRTLRMNGIGRGRARDQGRARDGCWEPNCWVPGHRKRLEFVTSLPGVLKGARVFCDMLGSRLICGGAEYRVGVGELEVEMGIVGEEVEAYRQCGKKRGAAQVGDDADVSGVEDLRCPATDQPTRKRAKIAPS